MMNFFHRYQSIILFAGAVIVLYGGYVFFFAPTSEEAFTATQTVGVLGSDQELIALLLELKSIHLDDTLFMDPLFKSLEDFGKELVTEPVGRLNPFAPIDGLVSKPK
jgi:hypothetical protein